MMAVLSSNRSALTNVVPDTDFKKPQHLPSKSVAKKQIQESEKSLYDKIF
jgi:hypothetical protein